MEHNLYVRNMLEAEDVVLVPDGGALVNCNANTSNMFSVRGEPQQHTDDTDLDSEFSFVQIPETDEDQCNELEIQLDSVDDESDDENASTSSSENTPREKSQSDAPPEASIVEESNNTEEGSECGLDDELPLNWLDLNSDSCSEENQERPGSSGDDVTQVTGSDVELDDQADGNSDSDHEEGSADTSGYDRPHILKAENVILSPEVRKGVTTHESVALSWDAHEDDSNVEYYAITYAVTQGPKHEMYVRTHSSETHFTVTDLSPATEYKFQIESVLDSGIKSPPAVHVATTRPASPPGKPDVSQISPTTFRMTWFPSTVIASTVGNVRYMIRIRNGKEVIEWEIDDIINENGVFKAEVKFTPNVAFKVQVYAECRLFGSTLPSPWSEECYLQATNDEICKAQFCAEAKKLPNNNPIVYQIKLRTVYRNDTKRLEKCEVGRPGTGNPEEKVIIVVGATGSGKTTLINGMVNYVAGVDWKDPFRFKLIVEDENHHGNQAVSQTSWITSYTIHHREGFRVPYTLNIIDTPGFGDTSGVMRDKEITEQISNFFKTPGKKGIDHIDAVGFVVQSSLPRLTPSQRYIFDQILSLFGNDISENIFLLLTFADGQKPQVLSGIKEANMPYQEYFKFNNSALFVENGTSAEKSDDDCNFDELFWKMGQRSFDVFYKSLHVVQSKSLVLTKDVLSERSHLEVYIVNIQHDVQEGLNKLEILQQECCLLKAHQAEIDANKEFKYTVEEERVVTKAISDGHYVTNCIPCKRTCHERCAYKDDEDKINCTAMNRRTGHCRVCPKGCIWKLHKNFPYEFVIRREKVTKTSEDLRKRYEDAGQKKLSAENLIEKVSDEFEAVQIKVIGMTEEIRKSIERLQEIALKPNPLSTLDYIDTLIDSEKHEGRPGWTDRVRQLRDVRRQVEYMKEVAANGFDPFKKYKEKIKEERKAKREGVWVSINRVIEKLKWW